MISGIMQPTFFPWMGYFDMIDKVDHFVFLDHVQLTKRSWQVRNRIKTPQGESFITISIAKTKSRDEQWIKDAVISYESKWHQKFLKTLEASYKKAAYFDEVYKWLEGIIFEETETLGELNIKIIKEICEKIGITTQLHKSSDISPEGKKDDMLVELSKTVSCEQYLSAQGSAVYIEETTPGGAFTQNSIELFYHDYEHPTYEQGKKEFLPYMAIVDLLLHVGFNNALSVIREGRCDNIQFEKYRKENLGLPNV